MRNTENVAISPGGGIGRRWRLKIFCPVMDVPVQVRPRAPSFFRVHRLLVSICLFLVTPFALAKPFELAQIPYPYSDQTDKWINSQPIHNRQLRGKPILVYFWTYGCYNCANTQKWMDAIYEKYADQGLFVLSIHTPEFEHEKNRENVVKYVEQNSIKYPVMLDNEYYFWKDMHNHWWPSFYLYDQWGQLKGSFRGEVHLNTDKAKTIEEILDKFVNS